MSLGILGGTFNPVHLAHLRIAEEVREALGLESVLFVPAGDPPHKRAIIAPFEQRLEMLEIATAPNPAFEVSDLEGRREGRSYTLHTLRELGARHPDRRLWFIIGSDAFELLEGWHRPEELFALASFAVVGRPGKAARPLEALLPATLARDFEPTPLGLEHRSGQEIREVAVTPLAVSASDLRRRVARGASLRYLVPDAVIDYIQKHGLYREET